MQLDPSHYRDYNITEPKFKLFLFQFSDKEDVILTNDVYKFSDTSTFYSNFDVCEFLNSIKCRLDYLINSNQCYIDLDDTLHFRVFTTDTNTIYLGGTLYQLSKLIKRK